MAECPLCKNSFSSDISYCPNCEVGLIPDVVGVSYENTLHDHKPFGGDTKQKPVKKSKKTFVELHRTENAALAALMKDFLENHNIVCYVDNYFSQSLNVNLLMPNATSGVRVMVYQDDFEEAKGIVEAFFQED